MSVGHSSTPFLDFKSFVAEEAEDAGTRVSLTAGGEFAVHVRLRVGGW